MSGKHCMSLGLNGYERTMREFVYHRPTFRTDRFIRQKLSSVKFLRTDLSFAVWPVGGMACRPSIGDQPVVLSPRPGMNDATPSATVHWR